MTPDPDGDISEILKRVRRIELKTRGLVRDGIAGEYHSCFKGSGIDFEDFREYQHGDEIRSIDWNVTARMGDPFIKKFSEERDLTVFLIVDVSASGDYGSIEQSKRELAAEVAAVLAFSALQNKDKVGLILFSGDVQMVLPPKKGAGQILRVIREILHCKPTGNQTNPGEALKTLSNLAKRRCLAFLVSDFLFELTSEAVRSASAKHDLVAIQVSDPAEEKLPAAGVLRFLDPESGNHALVNTSNPNIQHLYDQERAQWQREVEAFFRKHKVDLIKVSTDPEQDYMAALHAFFRQRERVQIQRRMEGQLGQPQIPDLPEDIIGPDPMMSLLPMVITLLVVLAVAAVGLRLFWVYRRRTRVAPEIHPVTQARFELARLYAQASEWSPKELATRLPRIVKQYLDAKYGLQITSLTTSELWANQSAWEGKVPRQLMEGLAALLDLCDAVKFDSLELGDEIKSQLFESAQLGDLAPDGSWDLQTEAQKALTKT